MALLFGRLGIDTQDVLAASGTKWNFLPFRPGLVGGHCIGVDPYYLTHKADEVGYHPQVILAGRRINDGMGGYVADQVALQLARAGRAVGGARVVVLGLTFKENVPDLRNTRVVDVIDRLREYGAVVDVVDPWVDAEEARREYGLEVVGTFGDLDGPFDAAILAVNHDQFDGIGPRLRELVGETGVIYDVKGALPRDVATGRL